MNKKDLNTIKEIRKLIDLPENKLRGITESTGLRILDGIYMILSILDDMNSKHISSWEAKDNE